MQRSVICHSVEETQALGKRLAAALPKGAFLALYGDLGVGKTAFVRGLASYLTPSCAVSSPTYTVVNVYQENGNRINHFDLYRITDEESLESVGFYDYLGQGVTVCEWCENIPFALPEDHLRLTFGRLSDTQRQITIECVGAFTYADLGD